MTGASERYQASAYVLDVKAVERPDGEWVCRVAYEELPGCVIEDPHILDALAKVDELRERWLEAAERERRPIPAPRLPLRS